MLLGIRNIDTSLSIYLTFIIILLIIRRIFNLEKYKQYYNYHNIHNNFVLLEYNTFYITFLFLHHQNN